MTSDNYETVSKFVKVMTKILWPHFSGHGVYTIMYNLSYGKDDSAMRPINGCPENLRESLNTPMATFSRNL